MPDQAPSFEQVLESDLRQLAVEIKNSREHPEMKNASEQELVKEALRVFPQTNTVPQPAVPLPPRTNSPLPAYATSASPEVKLEIEYLLDIALKNGISKALNESEKSPYFVQDAFHDALAGKLYPELQKRGMVK